MGTDSFPLILLLVLVIVVLLTIVARIAKRRLKFPRVDEIFRDDGAIFTQIRPGYVIKEKRAPIMTRSGREISLQASDGSFSIPRQDNGPYTAAEVAVFDTRGVPLSPRLRRESEPYGREGNPGLLWGYLPEKDVKDLVWAFGGEAEG